MLAGCFQENEGLLKNLRSKFILFTSNFLSDIIDYSLNKNSKKIAVSRPSVSNWGKESSLLLALAKNSYDNGSILKELGTRSV